MTVHSRLLRGIAWGALLVSALVIVSCGGEGARSYQGMSCATYLSSSDHEREDIIESAAKEFGLQMMPPGVGGLYDQVRIVVDERCRSARLLYTAMATASRETSSSLPKLLAIRPGRIIPTDTPVTTAQPAASARAPFKPNRTIVWGAKDSGAGSDGNMGDVSEDWIQSGATAAVTVELGRISKGRPEAIPADFSRLATVCTLDPDADAVVPMRMTIRNTSDVTLNTVVDGWIDNPGSAPNMSIDAATTFAAGDECQAHSGNTNYKWRQNDVAPSKTVVHDWLVVVHNYYPSDYPDGHKVPLSKGLASFRLSTASSDGELPMDQTTCYDGPRTAGINPMGFRPSFSLSGDFSRLGDRVVMDHPDELDAMPEC